ncbi:trypsin-like peptidase domain-containing protein [Clostridium carnis]
MNEDNKEIYDVNSYENVASKGEEVASDLNEENNSYKECNNNYKFNSNDENKKSRKSGTMKSIAIMVVVGLLGGIIGGGTTYFAMRNLDTDKNKNTISNPPVFETSGQALSATQAFEKVAPAVVIVSSKGVTNYGGFIPQEVEGIGSGFIINAEGNILTNYHVIEGAQEVTVTLSDKREVKAKVVNFDKNQDVAMLKIVDDNIKVPAVVELGDSDALKPGEQVLAIGTPLSKNFSQTVTGGLVSAINRNVETKNGIKLNLIQTDAPINPGNSGGPLINTKGEVVGINTLKLGGEAEGIGFSIPINEVKGRIESLSKPILNLGVSIREVDETLSKQYEMPEGLYVVEVTQFSPAEKAGIKGGDIITKFDGKKIKTFNELKEIRDSKKEGDIVKVEVVRNKETKTFDLQLTSK